MSEKPYTLERYQREESYVFALIAIGSVMLWVGGALYFGGYAATGITIFVGGAYTAAIAIAYYNDGVLHKIVTKLGWLDADPLEVRAERIDEKL